MLIILFYIMIMLCLIAGHKTVISGASYGLMLWYNNVLPLLMPFMLVSGLIVSRIKALPKKLQKKYAVIITLFTGLLCGYPLGAKNANDFIMNGSFDIRTGQLLLAFVNNCSPMFLLGYIISNLLQDKISFYFAVFVIYMPYLILIFIKILFYKLSSDHSSYKAEKTEGKSHLQNISGNDYIMSTILQITYVGFYIMICSIISEYILSLNILNDDIRIFAASLTEITKGAHLIADNYMTTGNITENEKAIAIMLVLTSFGGISAILQTGNVIKESGMSILKYILEKTVCSISTYGLAMLLYNYL